MQIKNINSKESRKYPLNKGTLQTPINMSKPGLSKIQNLKF